MDPRIYRRLFLHEDLQLIHTNTTYQLHVGSERSFLTKIIPGPPACMRPNIDDVQVVPEERFIVPSKFRGAFLSILFRVQFHRLVPPTCAEADDANQIFSIEQE